ncbi:unnamed protein product [Coffea canephora]|uniref:Bet v I/Major latex protein domain-containing protein n=3 Tax=Coffea TaxID=13442 RepID=A0A068UP63_COFCA|nr:major allergen Pru ar 1-like [Coffea arabica]XP_027117018.1 major allergen Pru ar 1-like [Coffea arabica]CDP10320.1 unnamed protein product [Coffea canephora]
MAPVTSSYEVTCSIPPARLFKATILEEKHLHKILPQGVKSVEILEGDGGVGTIKLTTFVEGGELKTAKQKVDGIDKEKFTYSYTVLEADGFNDVIEKICCVIKFEPSADGGSICKTTNTYYPKGGAQISEEHVKGGKEKGLGMVKAVEAYLHANPTAYN